MGVISFYEVVLCWKYLVWQSFIAIYIEVSINVGEGPRFGWTSLDWARAFTSG